MARVKRVSPPNIVLQVASTSSTQPHSVSVVMDSTALMANERFLALQAFSVMQVFRRPILANTRTSAPVRTEITRYVRCVMCCVCVCVCVCMCLCMDVCMCVCVCIYVCVKVSSHMSHLNVDFLICVCMYVCVCVCM